MASPILQKIADRSPVFTGPEAWGFLTPVNGMRNLLFGDSGFLDDLLEKFSSEQLESARVLVRGSENRLVLNPMLGGESPKGLFLRRDKDGVPFDIVNLDGSLTTDDPPAFACSTDYFTKHFSGESQCVFVAFSNEDLGVLRMLSMPCTPAAGLADVNGEQLRRLFQTASGLAGNPAPQKRSAAVAAGNYRLVLAGWCIAALKNAFPDGLAPVIERAIKAEDAYGFDTSRRCEVWRPTAQEFDCICSAVEFQDRPLIRRLLWRSARHSTKSVRQFKEEGDAASAIHYATARNELISALSRARQLGLHSPAVVKQLEFFNRSFDKNIVDAIIRDAMAENDPVNRALLLAASELMGYWHRSSSLVRSTEEGVSGRYQPREEELNPEELKDRLRVVDGLVKIHRELTRNK